jgi:regulatory protein
MPAQRSTPSLRGKALQWLAQRDQSRAELRQKLLRWSRARQNPAPSSGTDEVEVEVEVEVELEPIIDRLLDELVADGHLSDQRFIESRLHLRQARFGNRRIEYELAQHGLKIDAAERQALVASECSRAARVLAQRFSGADPPSADPRERQKRQRFLAARGFSPQSIRAVLRGEGLQDDDPADGDATG